MSDPFPPPAAKEPRLPDPVDRPTNLGTRRMRLLYVEDNRINALLFEQALHLRRDIELKIAEDGQQALEVVANWMPDLLVLDAHLPDMTGYTALQRLRALPGLASTPAYMCSADAHPDDLQQALEAGFCGYWTKPIDIRQVFRDLEQHTRNVDGAATDTSRAAPEA